MGEPRKVEIEHECDICGNDVATLTTEANQEPRCAEHEGAEEACAKTECDHPEVNGQWFAYDGDKVTCPECGAVSSVSCDGLCHAEINLAEEHPATVAAEAGARHG